MLTVTASTGLILLREQDNHLESCAADNMVYQNLPAIVFGFPLLFIATYAPSNPIVATCLVFGFFIALNVILFRKWIFKKRKKSNCDKTTEEPVTVEETTE
jgi:hypothetical protein